MQRCLWRRRTHQAEGIVRVKTSVSITARALVARHVEGKRKMVDMSAGPGGKLRYRCVGPTNDATLLANDISSIAPNCCKPFELWIRGGRRR